MTMPVKNNVAAAVEKLTNLNSCTSTIGFFSYHSHRIRNSGTPDFRPADTVMVRGGLTY